MVSSLILYGFHHSYNWCWRLYWKWYSNQLRNGQAAQMIISIFYYIYIYQVGQVLETYLWLTSIESVIQHFLLLNKFIGLPQTMFCWYSSHKLITTTLRGIFIALNFNQFVLCYRKPSFGVSWGCFRYDKKYRMN